MNNFDQTVIETAVGDALRQLGVSDNVFHNRPRSSTLDLKDFVVCKVTGAIRDYGAFGKCAVAVHLFALDVRNMKNGKKLSVMQGKLKSQIPLEIGNIVLDFREVQPIGDTPDGNGYHVRIVQLNNVIIKIV